MRPSYALLMTMREMQCRPSGKWGLSPIARPADVNVLSMTIEMDGMRTLSP